MTLFGRERGPHEAPEDSPDLAYVMSFVTSVGGLAAYWTLRSTLGLASGLGVGAAFCLGGWWIQSSNPERHEMAHQMCLIASVLFGGAMGYRAVTNPHVGPGGSMLAALGGVSSAYHLKKFLEWQAYQESRVHAAERLLRQFQLRHPEEVLPAGGAHNKLESAVPDGGGPQPHLERRKPVPPGGF